MSHCWHEANIAFDHERSSALADDTSGPQRRLESETLSALQTV
jgi:hypothetical protein